jgi:circadian clock protein KaiC
LTDRISTGSAHLDQIVHGGLLKNAINLITGVPGSGKTILSQQAVFHNATREQPALYLSTLSEPLDKILRYGASLSFFDADAIRDGRVIYHDIGQRLTDVGLDDFLVSLDRLDKEFRPGIVVIDGFRSLQAMSTDLPAYRQFLYGLVRRLTASAITSIWNAPYARSEVLDQAESAVADSILALDIKQIAEREVRVLQVLKLRGSGYQSGEHLYRVTADGLQVFPRLAETKNETPYALSQTHAATGIAALDELLENGGYWSGASTLVAGPSGIGKTLMGLHFLYRGAQAGEPGVLATFQENRTQLGRIVNSFGWSIDDPNVQVMSRGVVDLNIDEWVYELLELVDRTGARRVVVDSLLDVLMASGDGVRFREWMFSLTQRFARSGVSLMMIMEVPELFQLRRISEHGISHLTDNVILLQYVQVGPELARSLTVLKTRAMRHHPVVRRYEITTEGFVLGEEVTPALA